MHCIVVKLSAVFTLITSVQCGHAVIDGRMFASYCIEKKMQESPFDTSKIYGLPLHLLISFFLFSVLRGRQLRNFEVTKGAPLPFAYVILTLAAFHYGNRVFTTYLSEIPDYFKRCFPDGMTWERSTIFKDGGVCKVNCNIRSARIYKFVKIIQ